MTSEFKCKCCGGYDEEILLDFWNFVEYDEDYDTDLDCEFDYNDTVSDYYEIDEDHMMDDWENESCQF